MFRFVSAVYSYSQGERAIVEGYLYHNVIRRMTVFSFRSEIRMGNSKKNRFRLIQDKQHHHRITLPVKTKLNRRPRL